jgi:hypothetical protein
VFLLSALTVSSVDRLADIDVRAADRRERARFERKTKPAGKPRRCRCHPHALPLPRDECGTRCLLCGRRCGVQAR